MRRWQGSAVVAVAAVVLIGGTGVQPAGAAAAPPDRLAPHLSTVVKGTKAGKVTPAADAEAAAARRTPKLPPVWPAASDVVVGLGQAATKSGIVSLQAAQPEAKAAVRVQVLDRAAAGKARRPVVLRLSGTDEPVTVSVDYSRFRTAFGGDYGNRLHLVELPECALSTPDKPECAARPVATKNDGRTLTGQAQGAGVLAVTSEPSGGSGDFKATDLKPSGSWASGTSSGDFTWSYPLRLPAAIGGDTPRLSLDYSSQDVDGETASTNNQPNAAGEGFTLARNYIERSYRSCADDMGKDTAGNPPNNTTKTGDQCWYSDNAVLSLNGATYELIRDDATGEFHSKTESGLKIERAHGAGNGARDGEHWIVTQPNGSRSYFGLNRLPGWSAGKPETGSTWTAPVYGNHPGEPCRAASYAASKCDDMPWRWNLDYTVDLHGNSSSWWYDKETNQYAANLDAQKPVTYTRGGQLVRVEYGTRTDAEFTGAPFTVELETANRCAADCDKHDAPHWPDTPWDLECTKSPCLNGSASFWTTKRVASITTKTNGDAVESWTLRHSYPDPGDNTRAGLWLDGITHRGLVGEELTEPEVTFDGVQLDNRVNGDSFPAMKFRRISRITNQMGGEVNVAYSDRECAQGNLPANPEWNTMRCFPVYWTPPGLTDPRLDYFHKYVTTRVVEVDNIGKAPNKTTAYTYSAEGGAWHYGDDDGLTPEKYRTYNRWRGYSTVTAEVGEGAGATRTETKFFRGMDGDRLPGGGQRDISVADSENNAVRDTDGLEGRPREVRKLNGNAEVDSTMTDPVLSEPTASRAAGGRTLVARYVNDGTVRTRVALDDGRAPRRTKTITGYDDHGMPTEVNALGEAGVATDDKCTTTTYARDVDRWVLSPVARTQTYAVACGTAPTSGDQVESDKKSFYTEEFDVEHTEELADFGTGRYAVTDRAKYDSYGRKTETWDARGAHTTTAYAPASGPATSTTVTNDLNHRSVTELAPQWGVALSTKDANDRVTGQAYDSLGRLTGVWKPGRLKGQAEPHLKYAYELNKDAPSSVTTSTLHPDGVSYVVTRKLVDGFGRERQEQTPTAQGRVISDTIYDSAGRAAKTNPGYAADGAPDTGLFLVTNEAELEQQIVTTFDGAGREVEKAEKTRGDVTAVTKTAHTGDRVDVTPPQGGTATSTISDALGRKVELRQYHGPKPEGTYDSTRYAYLKGELEKSVTDPAGNVWSYGYDTLGRRTSESDPDAGTTVSTFNDAGDKISTLDAKGRELKYGYDKLGRKSTLFEGTTKRAEWTYDTAAKGQLASSTRMQGTAAFRTEISGYSANYEPLGTTLTIPETPETPKGKLAGTYRFDNTFSADGSLATSTFPGAGGLAGETIAYSYDGLAKVSAMKGKLGLTQNTAYVQATQYDNLNRPGVNSFATSATAPFLEVGFGYTERGELRQTRVRKDLGTRDVSTVENTYDGAGNITKVTDTVAADRQCLRYDHLARLTEAWTPAADNCTAPGSLGGPAPFWQTYGYDAIGNRKSRVQHATPKGDVTTTYAYPAGGTGRPHALLSTSTADRDGTRTSSYSYDEIGNTTSRPGSSGQQTSDWDAEGNLAASSDSGGRTSYVDDAEGKRIVRADSVSSTLFLQDMEVRWNKTTNAVEATRFYEYGGQVVAQRSGSTVTWLVGDRQGTAQVAVEAAKQTVTQRRQLPFGELRGGNPAWPNGFGFQFGAAEAGGLTNVGARQYDADTGRFTSVDPLISTDDPQRMHGYAYANNSPVTNSDPTGKSWLDMVKWMFNMTSPGGMIVNAITGATNAAKAVTPKQKKRAEAKRHYDAMVKKMAPAFAGAYYNGIFLQAFASCTALIPGCAALWNGADGMTLDRGKNFPAKGWVVGKLHDWYQWNFERMADVGWGISSFFWDDVPAAVDGVKTAAQKAFIAGGELYLEIRSKAGVGLKELGGFIRDTIGNPIVASPMTSMAKKGLSSLIVRPVGGVSSSHNDTTARWHGPN